jgi:aromatic-L-amino-acid/L-tryptophan decarboxylase
MLAEQLANAMGSLAMLWQTSPAATEIEQVMIQWLRAALGLPAGFTGTIHDSATTATLSAILTMRERALDWQGNAQGLSGQPILRLYASAQTHSSVDKSIRIAGIGQANLVKVATDATLSMDPAALDAAIRDDLANGLHPAGVVLCTGGTSVGAFDRIGDCIAIARKYTLPTHVDAAWAGSAMICPEYRHLWAGIEGADSIVFNPHKWLGAQFDCAVQFLRDPGLQIKTLGLRQMIRNHVAWSCQVCEALRHIPGVTITTEPALSLFTFALADDAKTEALLTRINDDGRIYLTQTRHKGRYVIRVQVGTIDCTQTDVMMIADVVSDLI